MDTELELLKFGALPPELTDLDDRILDAVIAHRRESAAMKRMMAFAAVVSLGCGVVAGGAMPHPAVAAAPLSPLVPHSPLTQVGMAEAQ